MKTKSGNVKFYFLLVFGLLVIAFAAAEGGQQQAPAATGPSSLVGVTYSTNDGSVEVHFINFEKVDMYFQGEILSRTYRYDASSGTGKIIIREASAEIYDFTIERLNTTEQFALTPNINAIQQAMAVDAEYFLTVELEQLSGVINLRREVSAAEIQQEQAQRQAAASRASEDRERERQRKEAQEREALAAEIREMQSKADQLNTLKRFNNQQFQQFKSLYNQYQQNRHRYGEIPEIYQLDMVVNQLKGKLSKNQLKEIQ
ncbi:hypothetical protein FACS189479_02670 [Spirochaetia bacterium]|nr:hypothetical protein FACS189479_02670 [Spirochaetia bacterium]